MSQHAQRWIDAPDFRWIPDRPYRAEPHFAANDDATFFHQPETKTAPRASGYLLSRLVIGAAQGIGLLSLAQGHGDPAQSAALTMVLLFAPLLLLAGLGRIPGKLLLPWTLLASLALAALGIYQRGETGASVFILAGLFLFVGQALVAAWAQNGEPLGDYPAHHASAWTLAMQILLCALAAGLSFAVGGAALALLRQTHPGEYPAFLIAPLVTLCVAATSWLAMPPLLRALTRGAEAALTLTLPLLILLAAATGVAHLVQHWQPPLLLCLSFAIALLLCLNASYGDGSQRPRWREATEFAAAFALPVPVLLGSQALIARVLQLGWTSPRILAAATLALLAAYALFTIASALIALGGGGWMKRIERANLGLALVTMALAAALLSPIADPARLAAGAQSQRLQTTPTDAFDFSWLATEGRYGHDALERIAARKSAPDQARGAFLALIAAPGQSRPTPTEIGANIEVRTPGARLPSALLARDWSEVKTPGVPPCLTSAALSCDAYFMDLDGDGRAEILLVYGNSDAWWAAVMKQGIGGGWYPAGTLAAPPCAGSLSALRAGHFTPVAPQSGWKDLMLNGTRLAIALTGAKTPTCPAP